MSSVVRATVRHSLRTCQHDITSVQGFSTAPQAQHDVGGRDDNGVEAAQASPTRERNEAVGSLLPATDGA